MKNTFAIQTPRDVYNPRFEQHWHVVWFDDGAGGTDGVARGGAQFRLEAIGGEVMRRVHGA